MAARKLKSHSGASKRISKTGTGKLRGHKGGLRHLLTSKGRSRKRRLGRTQEIPKMFTLTIRRMLPD